MTMPILIGSVTKAFEYSQNLLLRQAKGVALRVILILLILLLEKTVISKRVGENVLIE